MTNSTSYLIGILDDSKEMSNKDLAKRAKELTEFLARHLKIRPISYISGTSIDEILKKSLEKNVKFCIIMSIGHFINDNKFFIYIEEWLERVDFFITGHIIDQNSNNSRKNSDNRYWGLHKQCIIVNLEYYKKFNYPEWNPDSTYPIELSKAKRSIRDIHDDYTPIFLESTEETQICSPFLDGWNFINISLKNKLKVYNFHPKIRATKKYVYPNKDINELQKQLQWLRINIDDCINCIFIWNTEKSNDIKNFATKNKNLEPISKLYVVAAGFKPNHILNYIGFNEKTEIIYFDYSKPALAFKRYLLENWDGNNYPDFVQKLKDKVVIKESSNEIVRSKSYEQLWEEEIVNWWGTESEFKYHWNTYKKLSHRFIHCNIVDNPLPLTSVIDSNPNSYIWWSNAFHTVYAHYTRPLDQLIIDYNSLISQIERKNPNMIVFGADILNNSHFGYKISDTYFNKDN